MTARDFSARPRTEHNQAIERGMLDNDPCLAQANLAPPVVAPAHGQTPASSSRLNVTAPAGFRMPRPHYTRSQAWPTPAIALNNDLTFITCMRCAHEVPAESPQMGSLRPQFQTSSLILPRQRPSLSCEVQCRRDDNVVNTQDIYSESVGDGAPSRFTDRTCQKVNRLLPLLCVPYLAAPQHWNY
jgi:hypothetical protein